MKEVFFYDGHFKRLTPKEIIVLVNKPMRKKESYPKSISLQFEPTPPAITRLSISTYS